MPLRRLKHLLGMAAPRNEAQQGGAGELSPAVSASEAASEVEVASASEAAFEVASASAPEVASEAESASEAVRLTPAMRTGAAAEAAAAAFLEEKGHRVLERNWRAGRDEIDLITQDGVCLVFVEVRARKENALVGGFHSIDKRKKAALRRVCSAYLNSKRPRPATYRLDVVQITLGKGGQMVIHHYAGVALFN